MGLRQVSISRYSMGWWPAKIIAFLNVIEQLGWSSVSCITGGLALTAASDGTVSLALGIVIIAVVGTIVSFIGLRAVLRYEAFAWIVAFVIFLICYGEAGWAFDLATPTQLTGLDYSGTLLTWLAIVYGSTASWSSIVSDYYVQYPVDTPSWKTFLLTTVGLSIPTSFPIVLGSCVGSALANQPDWSDAMGQGLGYLIQQFLYPYAFAKFILVLLVLSGIGNTCVSIYSCSLSIQQFARPLMVVPRILWTILVLAAILCLGIVGRDHLITILQNFLALLGYWNTSFFVILFSEHYIFRKSDYSLYDLEAWNTPSRMPIGLAGGFAFFVGVAGWVVGMAETYYVGPIGAMIGTYGGDIGNQLALVFTLAAYIPARWLELKVFGR